MRKAMVNYITWFFLFFSYHLWAVTPITGSRIIHHVDYGQSSLRIKNNANEPLALTTWVTDNQGNKSELFSALSDQKLLDINAKSTIKITTNHKHFIRSQESLYWLNIKEESNNNSRITQIKMLIRPSEIGGTSYENNIKVNRSTDYIEIVNQSPHFFSMTKILVDGNVIPQQLFLLAPNSQNIMIEGDFNAKKVTIFYINDHGIEKSLVR